MDDELEMDAEIESEAAVYAAPPPPQPFGSPPQPARALPPPNHPFAAFGAPPPPAPMGALALSPNHPFAPFGAPPPPQPHVAPPPPRPYVAPPPPQPYVAPPPPQQHWNPFPPQLLPPQQPLPPPAAAAAAFLSQPQPPPPPLPRHVQQALQAGTAPTSSKVSKPLGGGLREEWHDSFLDDAPPPSKPRVYVKLCGWWMQPEACAAASGVAEAPRGGVDCGFPGCILPELHRGPHEFDEAALAGPTPKRKAGVPNKFAVALQSETVTDAGGRVSGERPVKRQAVPPPPAASAPSKPAVGTPHLLQKTSATSDGGGVSHPLGHRRMLPSEVAKLAPWATKAASALVHPPALSPGSRPASMLGQPPSALAHAPSGKRPASMLGVPAPPSVLASAPAAAAPKKSISPGKGKGRAPPPPMGYSSREEGASPPAWYEKLPAPPKHVASASRDDPPPKPLWGVFGSAKPPPPPAPPPKKAPPPAPPPKKPPTPPARKPSSSEFARAPHEAIVESPKPVPPHRQVRVYVKLAAWWESPDTLRRNRLWALEGMCNFPGCPLADRHSGPHTFDEEAATLHSALQKDKRAGTSV